MILGFKTKFPWGEETKFESKIIACWSQSNYKDFFKPKIHTIREGQRWKAGDLLHMATGVRTKNYNQFNKSIQELERVKSVQRFDLAYRDEFHFSVFVGSVLMCSRSGLLHFVGKEWFNKFVVNDGFESWEQFLKWFNKPIRNGQIIHWTDKKY